MQLYELKSCREITTLFKDYAVRESSLDDNEKANYLRAIELEKQGIDLARKERDLYKEQVETYKQLYLIATKKPGFMCRFFKVITLGIGRCN